MSTSISIIIPSFSLSLNFLNLVVICSQHEYTASLTCSQLEALHPLLHCHPLLLYGTITVRKKCAELQVKKHIELQVEYFEQQVFEFS